MCNGFVEINCRRSGAAAVPTGNKIPSGGEEDTAVHSVDTKISTGDDEAAAVHSVDTKISSGGEEDTAVHSVDTKISTGGEEDTAVHSVDTKISTGGEEDTAVHSVGRLLLRPVCIFAHGKTLLLRPTLPNMSRCNHFFAAVMNPLFLIFLLVRPALSSFKGLRVRGSRFCCYRRFYDD